ncbi:MAG: hypothetical protein A2790_02470 [Phenylobacterium sp. RIFCSPHIGHO2_01_FULL_69_31]|uniref:DUF6644 family protein n=1 Tax=Phenylobacterium sp. RIFCSPHIGHO2_01_FULL_69_31 TaxID=1801944 RepID=UPI0008AD1E0D|nr:DUF6644 family protein [Phenylobacterium sp. RIFCSPHIGHO2_01_FULL_69_31]OHB31397.1 MAG: hypothetical protein A2790_02470 [Phenylobacterium sp. RIFCSPHIGHO2_01_FULL_69_31]
MIRDFLVWLATQVGKGPGEYDPSWSEALASTLNVWGLLEGTHVLSLMLFAGTIFLVDLRLLGVGFKTTPVSVISDRVLPLTVFGFALMIVTGVALFYAKPLLYYHNLWFRLKLIFLAVAVINIFIFHYRVQKDRAAWDTAPKPPGKARLSAAVSIASWVAVIMFGRFIAYDWYECGKPLPHWANVAQECAVSERGAIDLTEMAQ